MSSMNKESYIRLSDIKKHVTKSVVIKGWVYNIRSSGKIIFLQIRDGFGTIQGVMVKNDRNEPAFEHARGLTLESSITVTGKVKEDNRAPTGYELEITDLTIIQKAADDYPIGKKEHGPDFLLDHRHLWLRSSRQWAILKIRDALFFNLISFLKTEGFTRIDTPILQPTSCEDTSELFSVNFFGIELYLTQSGQLYLEAAEMSLGKVYDFGPVFRAEKSKTRKHLNEFWMMDAELPFTNLDEMMVFIEKLIKHLVSEAIIKQANELKILARDVTPLKKVTQSQFIRLKHKDVISLLNQKYGSKLSSCDDIGAPEEEMLSQLYDLPVFVTDWPAKIKAFYMPHYQDHNIERVKAMDLICSEGYGEIVGGAEREHDHQRLIKVMKKRKYKLEDYKWYLDLRRYGSIPHSGFGIGMERIVAWICGLKHVRETIPFPRLLNRNYP